jgi:hypothetical protein
MHLYRDDYIIELVENALNSKAKNLYVKISEKEETFSLIIEDDGCGIDSETVKRVCSPFFSKGDHHPGRNTGLGLAFLSQCCEQTGGRLSITSQKDHGTKICVQLPAGHVDCPPFYNLPLTLAGLFSYSQKYELVLERERDGELYKVRRSELIAASDLPIDMVSLAVFFEESEKKMNLLIQT